MKSPVAFWIGNTHDLWDTFFWRPMQGHNGYLDVYLELGIVGLIFLTGVLIAAYRGIFDLLTRQFEQGALHLTWLTIIVIHNITESSYLKGTVDLWFLFLLSAVIVIIVGFLPLITAQEDPAARIERECHFFYDSAGPALV